MALVSIVTPVYNAARFLGTAIGSVQSQRFTDWEMLLVVDAKSTDASERMAREAAGTDPRIRVCAANTCGAVANRNHGLEQASAPYVAFLDSDDWWHPSKLERQLALMQETKAGLSCTGYYRMSEDGMATRSRVHVAASISYRDLLAANSIGCLTAMVDRRIFPDCRFPDQRTAEDYALWLSLLRAGGRAVGLDEPLAYYREVKGSLSSRKLNVIACRWRTFRQQEKLPLVHAAYYLGTGLWHAIFGRKRVHSTS